MSAISATTSATSSATDDFDAAYPALFRELVALARALGAWHEAEDVAQEALVHGRAHLGDLRDPCALRPWLRRIAARGAARAREQRRRAAEPERELSYLPVDPALGLDATAAVRRLPERERLAVALVYGLGYEQEEAAQMLGIARGTVAASLWKARQRLARELRPEGVSVDRVAREERR